MTQTASMEDKAQAFDLMIKHQMVPTFGRMSFIVAAEVVDDIGDKHSMNFSGSLKNDRPIVDVAIEVIRDAATRLDGIKGE